MTRRPHVAPSAPFTPPTYPRTPNAAEPILAPARAIPLTDEELRILCLPMAVDGAPELAEARCSPRDTLEAWQARMRDVCGGCGLRALDAEGKCGKCGRRKART